MKLTTKGKRVIGMVTTMPVLTALLIGLSAPAVAPSKAEAQMLMLKKYQNEAVLPPKDLVGLLQAVGFQGQNLKYAWAVAMKESHGNALDFNGNIHTGDHSYGLFQINMLGSMGADRRTQFGLAYNAELLNPVKNAQIAYHMSGGGKNWSAWKGTRQQVVQDWLAKYPYNAHTQAKKAVAKAKVKVKAVGYKTKAVRKTKPKQKPKQ
jgi:Lysozyme like domain